MPISRNFCIQSSYILASFSKGITMELPRYIPIPKLRAKLGNISGVKSVEALQVWFIEVAQMNVKLVADGTADQEKILAAAKAVAREYRIRKTYVQIDEIEYNQDI